MSLNIGLNKQRGKQTLKTLTPPTGAVCNWDMKPRSRI